MPNSCLGFLSSKVITNIIYNHPQFKVIHIPGNMIGNNGAKEFASLMKSSATILSLDVSSNGITDEGMAFLIAGVRSNQSIVSISIGNLNNTNRNRFGHESLTELEYALQVNQLISEIDLSGSDLTQEHAKYLSNGMNQNQSLKVLSLGNNNLKTRGIGMLLDSSINSRLTELNIQSNNITDDFGPYLSNFLSKNRTIASINLSGNKLTAKFMETISEYLSNESSLRTLIMSQNPITTKGLSYLSFALRGDSHIEKLIFQKCKITSNGIKEFTSSLVGNHSLRTLILSHNPLKDDGISTISKDLIYQSGLRVLEIDWIEMTDVGCIDLMKYVEKGSLQRLSIKSNLIKDGLLIMNTVLKNQSVRSINIDFNDINFKTSQDILAIVDEHQKKWELEKINRLKSTLYEKSSSIDQLQSIRTKITSRRTLISNLEKEIESSYVVDERVLKEKHETEEELKRRKEDLSNQIRKQFDQLYSEESELGKKVSEKEHLTKAIDYELTSFRNRLKIEKQKESMIETQKIGEEEKWSLELEFLMQKKYSAKVAYLTEVSKLQEVFDERKKVLEENATKKTNRKMAKKRYQIKEIDRLIDLSPQKSVRIDGTINKFCSEKKDVLL